MASQDWSLSAIQNFFFNMSNLHLNQQGECKLAEISLQEVKHKV